MPFDIILSKIVNFCLKLKNLFYKLPTALALICCCILSLKSHAQTDSSLTPETTPPVVENTIDSTANTSNTEKVKEDISTTIKYNASDSIRFNVFTQEVILYKNAWVDYGDMKLDADLITINWSKSIITATYTTDSSGRKVGVPHFIDGNNEYTAEKIIYNYKTKKGYISNIVTSDGEGYLTGENALKDDKDNLLIDGAKYTTCNMAEPHYHFRLRKTKVVNKKKVYTNFFNLYIDEIPMPLGLPFGIFPMANKKSSGIIIPTWGEAASRGFFLRDGGYYWAVNDYIGAKFLGEIYSNGGWGSSANIDYKKRYSYSGDVDFSYRDIVRNGDQYDRTSTKDYRLRWVHTPQSRGGKSFSSNVNYATTSYYANNTINVNNNLANTLNSTVRYYVPIKNTPFNATFNLAHDQNNQTGIVNMSLPDFNLSMNRITPFKSATSTGKKSTFKKFYESISVQYNFDMENKISNAPNINRFPFDIANEVNRDTVGFTAENFGTIWQNKELGMKHTIPINGTMKLGPFSLNGNFTYSDYWYPKSFDYDYNSDSAAVLVTQNNGFQRTNSYNGGANLTTNLYGMYSFLGKRQRQIRHTVRPSLGMSMAPDYTKNSSIFSDVQVNELGETVTISKFNGLLFTAPSSKKSASLTFGIQNVLEMKNKSIKDTTVEYKKTKLLESFNVNSSYNFAADSLNLAKFNINANTNLFNVLNVRFNSTLDPYTFKLDSNGNQYRVNTLAWEDNQGIGNFESWSLALSTNLNPQAFKSRYKNQAQLPENVRSLLDDPANYVDFNIPWSLNISYTYTENQVGFNRPKATQSLQASGDIKISQSWKIGYNAAYDFENKKIVTPRLNIYKDLHCWEMRFAWVPYGPQQMYEFYINVKASVLQDLKWSRRRSYYDR